MPSKLVDPDTIPTQTFDWGIIKPLVAVANTESPAMSLLHVVLLPVAATRATTTRTPTRSCTSWLAAAVDDGEPFPVAAGQAVFIPTAAWHSTINTGWEPLSLLAIYAPAGAEEALRGLPDFREVPPGEVAGLART